MKWLPQRGSGSKITLPAGQQFALTWTIPHDFGGITHALLERSKAFDSLTNTPVDVLTFHHLPDVPKTRRDLQARGLLRGGVSLRNLWEEVAALDDAQLRSFEFDDRDNIPADPFNASAVAVEDSATLVRRQPVGHDLEIHRHEVHRSDGSLLARQDWIGNFTKAASIDRWGDRALSTTLFDRSGQAVGGWAGAFGFFHAWLDLVFTAVEGPAFAITDVSPVADFIASYRRPDVHTVQVMHASHLKRGRIGPYAALSDWRKYPIEHRASFDANVFLTTRQHDDVDLLLGPDRRSFVVGNSQKITAGRVDLDRRRGAAVTVGRLVQGKRFQHAIRAMDLARRDNPDVRLELHGTGSAAESLAELVNRLDIDSHVAFKGYTVDVTGTFAHASFSLMTSAAEGFGLVLLESMSVGCIPIAYDVPYGPAEIIEHGVSGFLVGKSDPAALAQQITKFLAMDERSVRAMRKAAIARARSFGPEPITSRWANVLKHAAGSSLPAVRIGPTELRDAELIAGRIRTETASLEATAVNIEWEDARILKVDVTARLSLHGDPSGAIPSATLVQADTGVRRTLAVAAGTETDSDGQVTFAVSLDTMTELMELGEPPSVVMIALDHGGVSYEDTIRSRRMVGPLAPLPLTPFGPLGRLTCHVESGWGLVIRRPVPRVVAHGTTDADTVDLVIDPESQERVDHIQFTSRDVGESVEATRSGPNRWTALLPQPAEFDVWSWDIRARCVDGTWRKIAWSGDSADLLRSSHGAQQFETTAYGYLRVTTQRHRPILTAISSDSGVLSITVEGSADLALALVRGDEWRHSIGGTGGAATFDLISMPPGRYGLCAGESAAGSGIAVVTSPQLQRSLPIRIDENTEIIRSGSSSQLQVIRRSPPGA